MYFRFESRQSPWVKIRDDGIPEIIDPEDKNPEDKTPNDKIPDRVVPDMKIKPFQ